MIRFFGRDILPVTLGGRVQLEYDLTDLTDPERRRVAVARGTAGTVEGIEEISEAPFKGAIVATVRFDGGIVRKTAIVNLTGI